MTNLKKYLLIGGAYLCVTGSAMAESDVSIAYDHLFAEKNVRFEIYSPQAGKNKAICRGSLSLKNSPELVSCAKLKEIKEPTILRIDFFHEGKDNKDQTICKDIITYEPNTDININLKEDRALCTLDFDT